MARNDQVIRQWHLMQRLESSTGLTLHEIVDGLPDEIPRHHRTVRRASSRKIGRREVNPYHLWYAAGGLYLIGYCHRRRDVRMFAVERIRSLTVTDHPYQLPLGFDVEAYVQDALVVMRGRQIDVELVFDRATATWTRDRVWHPSQRLASLPHGRLRMTLRVADTRELVGWILSFGRGVKVIKPAELRERVWREARAVANQ